MTYISFYFIIAVLSLIAVGKIENAINHMKKKTNNMSSQNDVKHEKCELCGVECECTKHHLIPVSRTRDKYKDIRDDDSNLIWICRQCHDQIHAVFDNTQLRDLYNTKEKLMISEEMKKYVAWKMKHPDFKGHSKMSNERKHR